MIRRLLPLLALLLLAAPAWARTATAVSTTGGNWSVAASWDGSPTLPATTDVVVVPSGKWITLDYVAPASGAFASVEVQSGGHLTINPANNTGITQSGDSVLGISIDSGATLDVASPGYIDPAHTCQFSITPASDGGAGLLLYGTVTGSGAAKTPWVLLGANTGTTNHTWAQDFDIAYAGTSFYTATLATDPTGWAANDIVTFAPTGRTYTHWDVALVSSYSSPTLTLVTSSWNGTAPTYTAAGTTVPSWNHQGAGSPAQARAEVLNLSRNFKVFSTSTAHRMYCATGTTNAVSLSYIEFYECGIATAGKMALSILTTTGSVTGTGCTFHDCVQGITIGALTTGTVTPTSWIVWKPGAHAWNILNLTLSGGGACTLVGCIGAYTTTASNDCIIISSGNVTVPSFRAIGGISYGVYIPATLAGFMPAGMLDGVVSHSNGDIGLLVSLPNSRSTPVVAPQSWRNGNYGIYPNIGAVYGGLVWVSNPVAFGNVGAQFRSSGQPPLYALSPIVPTDSLAGAGSAISVSYGSRVWILGGSLAGSINEYGSGQVNLSNVTWTPSTFFSVSDGGESGGVICQDLNGTPGNTEAFYTYGSILSSTGTKHNNTLSYQHLPTGGAGVWFRPNSPPGQINVRCLANTSTTVRVWVMQGASYNGTNPPRLVALGGYATGVGGYGASTTGAGTAYLLNTTVSTSLLTPTSGIVPVTGTEIMFSTTVNGLTAGQVYYAINPTATTFQVSTTVSGSPVSLSGSNTTGLGWSPRDIIGTSWTGTPGTTWTMLSVTVMPTETGSFPVVVEGQGSVGSWYVAEWTGKGVPIGWPDAYFGINGFGNITGVVAR